MFKIAISGRAGSGKNTAANLIAENILNLKKEEYCIGSFASKIKEIISLMFPGCDQEALYGASHLRQNKIVSDINKSISTDVSFRSASLDIGKLGRSYNPYFWVGHIAHQYQQIDINVVKLYIISDVRFCEEFEWLKQNGFVMCRIKRNDLISIDDVSETEQEKLPDSVFDFIIHNNANIEILQRNLASEIIKYHNIA